MRSDPVESEASLSSRDPNLEALDKIYELAPEGRSAKTCGDSQRKLSELAPGSKLEVVGAASEHPVELGAGSQTVFNLTLVAAEGEDKHFCYTCTPVEKQPPGPAGTPCSVFATVPAKKPVPPPNENVDGQTEEQPGGQTNQQTDSGAYSPSLFSWPMLTAAGCASALALQL